MFNFIKKKKMTFNKYDLLLCLVCLASVSGLNTLTYTYPNTYLSPNIVPSYPLGYLNAQTTVEFEFLVLQDICAMGVIDVWLTDSRNDQIVYDFPEICNGEGSIYSSKYTVLNSGQYYLLIMSKAHLIQGDVILKYSLVIYTYPVNQLAQKQVLMRISDIIRQTAYKVIYLKQQTTITVTQYPVFNSLAILHLEEPYPITGQDNNIAVSDVITRTGADSCTNDIQKNEFIIGPGYYAIMFDYMHESDYELISFQSDPYPCPYDPSFVDFYGVFQGCIFQQQEQQGLPCTSINPLTHHCEACLAGYSLVNFICFADTACPDRQYFHFGQCYNVSQTCGDFDRFTGICLNCINPLTYVLTDGVCLLRGLQCSQRQWINVNKCENVSNLCDLFDRNTGFCKTCITPNIYEVKIGVCIQRQIVCLETQYVVNLTCVNIPVACQKFSKSIGRCLQCYSGYTLKNGDCVRMTCPKDQYPSIFSADCIDVSPLCKKYDPNSGDCLSCKDYNYVVSKLGKCLQVVNGLAGCHGRQLLGYGKCQNPYVNCKVHDLINGDCETCDDGYYLDYRGLCVPEAFCKRTQWSINGQCLEMPANCVEVDRAGICSRCQPRFRLINGQCAYIPSCGNRQYLGDNGFCIEVNQLCDKFNPSNGHCYSCRDNNTTPNQGVCCPEGQIYRDNICKNEESLILSLITVQNEGECIIFHPILGICLSCGEDYDVDEVTYRKCIKRQ